MHFIVGDDTHRLIIVVAAHKDLFVIAFPVADPLISTPSFKGSVE